MVTTASLEGLMKSDEFVAEKFQEFFDKTEFYVRLHVKRFNPKNRMPLEDVVWNCFTDMYRKKTLHKFGIRTTFWTYYQTSVRNWLMDKEKYDSRRVLISDTKDEKVATYRLTAYAENTEQRDLREKALVVMDYLRGRKYDTAHRTGWHKDHGLVAFTPYNLVRLHFDGYSYRDLSYIFSMSVEEIREEFFEAVHYLKTLGLEDIEADGTFDDAGIESVPYLEFSNELLDCLRVVSRRDSERFAKYCINRYLGRKVFEARGERSWWPVYRCMEGSKHSVLSYIATYCKAFSLEEVG